MTPLLDECYEFRKRLVGRLTEDLLGPTAPDEIITDAPITKYLTGVLYPQGTGSIDGSEHVDDELDDHEETPDPPVTMANVRYPSSMGITFAVDTAQAREVRVHVEVGRYTQVDQEEGDTAKEPRRRRGDTDSGQAWKRIPVTLQPVNINVSEPATGSQTIAEGLELFHRVRARDGAGRVPVTLVLVNRLQAPARQFRDAHTYFQPFIRVSGMSNTPPFIERPTGMPPSSDQDMRSYRLLYRHARTFATGHGCSVEWDVDSREPERANEIRSTFVPRHDLALADSNPRIRNEALGMKFLAEAPVDDLENALHSFCSDYEQWIVDRDSEVASLPLDLQPIAREQLDACKEALARMKDGTDKLSSDKRARRAFRLANRTMLEQRARTEWLKKGRPTPAPVPDGAHQWYPFQLAFILLCLVGIADEASPDRDLADLLWFPTGGGKTEAYLGLIAFAAYMRRLRRRTAGAGVCVIMRYTLRLLTIQQFERAALLICAMEETRRNNREELGDEEFSIGLWVGQDATTNDLRLARQSLDRLRRGQDVEKGSPVQLHSCPWCGTPLDHTNYYISEGRGRLVITCRQDSCTFKPALPVYVIDEDIYRVRPTLVIATADKFASMPWRPDAASLFNLNKPVTPPPELIIQDELHLISGPLGTLAGLYEAAVDLACSRDGAKPKVIASTATIRRAADQARALFDREVRQFPPQGIDARDSYFAIEADPAVKGTRLYLGAMAPGTSQTTLLVRTYGALLQAAKDIAGADEARDPYWTLVGYFNSLRVLGGARMQVQDDVKDRIGLLAAAHGSTPRDPEPTIELTSREPSGNIPGHLKQMALRFPDPNALGVVLATNMISVGVDIDRLGLMSIMGQPQSTSEYIQASSRVGRRYPGLIVTMFNAARSRDRSHYENFISYHSALYRQVESTSATPFSARARDRGLHAVMVALARLLVPGARSNTSASDIANFRASLEGLRDAVVARVSRISPRESEATRIDLDELIAHWEARLAENPDLVFANPSHPDRALLIDAARDDVGDESFPTLWSLRDVDKSSNLYLVGP